MTQSITIASINESYSIEEDDVILDAGLNHGYNLPHSCRGGSCSSCRAQLMSGEVDYLFEPLALTDEEKDSNIILTCACVAKTDVTLEFIDGDVKSINEQFTKVQQLPVKITSITQHGNDLAVVIINTPKTKNFDYTAGQYIDFTLRDGKRRSFSIANHRALGSDSIELHIRMIEGGQFTPRFFNGSIKKGDILKIAGPYGNFKLQQSNRPIIFLAGGTGVAPIKGIIENAIDKNYQVPMKLYWGVRSADDLYLDTLLKAWQDSYEFFTYIPVLSRPEASANSAGWSGKIGYAYATAVADIEDFSDYDVYASGRPAFVDDTKAQLLLNNLSEDHYYFDAFEFAAN